MINRVTNQFLSFLNLSFISWNFFYVLWKAFQVVTFFSTFDRLSSRWRWLSTNAFVRRWWTLFDGQLIDSFFNLKIILHSFREGNGSSMRFGFSGWLVSESRFNVSHCTTPSCVFVELCVAVRVIYQSFWWAGEKAGHPHRWLVFIFSLGLLLISIYLFKLASWSCCVFLQTRTNTRSFNRSLLHCLTACCKTFRRFFSSLFIMIIHQVGCNEILPNVAFDAHLVAKCWNGGPSLINQKRQLVIRAIVSAKPTNLDLGSRDQRDPVTVHYFFLKEREAVAQIWRAFIFFGLIFFLRHVSWSFGGPYDSQSLRAFWYCCLRWSVVMVPVASAASLTISLSSSSVLTLYFLQTNAERTFFYEFRLYNFAVAAQFLNQLLFFLDGLSEWDINSNVHINCRFTRWGKQ